MDVLAIAWPAAVAFMATIFMVTFRQPIARAIDRSKKLKIPLALDADLGEPSLDSQAASTSALPSPASSVPAKVEQSEVAPEAGKTVGPPPSHDALLHIEAKAVRILENVSPEHQQAWAVRMYSVARIESMFESTFRRIYRSQLDALRHLNQLALASDADLRVFYTRASEQHPDAYAAFGFEAWRSFLFTEALLSEPDALGHFGISIHGREFLIWLVRNAVRDDRIF